MYLCPGTHGDVAFVVFLSSASCANAERLMSGITHGVELHALPCRKLDVPQMVLQMRDISVED